MAAQQRAFGVFTRCAARLLGPRTMRFWQRRFSKAKRIAGEVLRLNKALVLYYSETGNTEKVATAIKSGIERAGKLVTLKKLADATQ